MDAQAFKTRGKQPGGPSIDGVAGQSLVNDGNDNYEPGWANEFLNQFQGMSVISNRSCHCITSTTSAPGRTTRTELVCPFDVRDLVLIYENVQTILNGESPFPNQILVRAALEQRNYDLSLTGASIGDTGGNRSGLTFRGAPTGIVFPRSILTSDRFPVSLRANKRNFIYTCVANGYLTAPAAPTAVVAAGGFFSIGTFAVGITIVYPGGHETPGSTAASVTTAGSNKTISITAPLAATYPGAIGWRAWVSLVGTVTPLYDSGALMQPMGGAALNLTTALNNAYIGTAARVNPAGVPMVPQGGVSQLGGTGAGGASNGEYVVSADATGDGYQYSAANSSGGGYFYLAALGTDPKKIHKSLAIGGDSIATGSNDHGFMNGVVGGWILRACLNQTGRTYDATIAPRIPHLHVSTVGETALTFATGAGLLRSREAALCTHVAMPWGSNDLSQAQAATQLVVSQLAISSRFTDIGRSVYFSTITPRTASTDAWSSLANQTHNPASVTTTLLPAVRQWNNLCLAPDAASVAVDSEALMGLFAGSRAYNFNFLQGGDGTVLTFVPRVPFVVGSEQVRINGTLKTVSTDYTYYGSVTINGVNYASGFTMLSAPAGGATVAASYTSMPGIRVLGGSLILIVDPASLVTVNAAGTADPNGGLWKPGSGTVLVSGTSTGSNTAFVFNDTGKAWAVDQYRNYALRILTDSGTAAGQVLPIANNTATALNLVTSIAAQVGATYTIIDPYTTDGIHPSGLGSMTMAPAMTAVLPID